MRKCTGGRCIGRTYLWLFAFGMVLLLMGCTPKKNTRRPVESPPSTASVEANEITMEYSLTMKAVIKKVDTEARIVQLKNTASGMDYTLTYTGGTAVLDKYGQNKLMEEVYAGDLVEAYVEDTKNQLAAICYSKQNWKFEGSTNWRFHVEKQELIIGKDKYYYSDDLLILSEGREIDQMDLQEQDILDIQGCGKKVLSVTLAKGHGYVRLEGIDDFVGGWVEIGKVIKPISKDMLITVPEGNWDVTVVKDGYGGKIGTTVERDKEHIVNFSDVASKIVRYGTVEFTLEPEDAKLYIAGREMDTNQQLLLEYDTYKIRVSADGYEDYTGDLKVDKALIGKKISLKKTGEDSTAQPSASAPVTESPQPSQAASLEPALPSSAIPAASSATGGSGTGKSDWRMISGSVIKVNTPKNVSVYFDGAFVGVSPVSFTKIAGSHTLTFSKSGYKTKSYSVEISSDNEDVNFDLPELEHAK